MPGPGNYKMPSEFGHYESKTSWNSRMMKSTSAQFLKPTKEESPLKEEQ
jgi:hypothetical protein